MDSWAILAWLKNQEPAAGVVRRLFEGVGRRENRLFMSILNVGEVYYLSVKEKDFAHGEAVVAGLRGVVDVVSAPDNLVMAAAGLKGRYRISYADAFAAATAMRASVPLVTGDRELRAMATQEKNLKLEWIGST